ncbi:MAG TPA: hypothetical protein VGM82_09175 [Gemmatimonadaceae bacterium]|jgi:hypothetical protein
MAHIALSPEVRIVLAGVPGLTAALIREYAATQPGIVIVGEWRQSEELPLSGNQEKIDVVVTARGANGIPNACQRALFGPQALPVIAVGSDGRLETFERHAVGEAAMDDLFVEIRRVTIDRTEPRAP